MLKKTSAILFLSFIAASLLLVSCGGNSGGSSGAVPEVVVGPGSNPIDGNPADETSGIVIINPHGGNLDINGESVSPENYNLSNTDASVTAVNGAGDCAVTVSDDGTIKIIPAGGTVEGTYIVTINTGEREYILIIEVTADSDGDGRPDTEVITSISYPSGSSMILDLNDGKFVNTLNGNNITVTENGLFTGYEFAVEITVTGPAGPITVTVDPVTGDIVASGDVKGPFTIKITTDDGSVITITTDDNGKITGIAENNSTLILNLDNGSVSSAGYNLSLTAASGDGAWALAGGVQILSVTAAGGAIQQIDTARLWINQSNGDIMIAGSNGVEPPVGPYEIKVSAGSSVYVIKTDINGQVVSILPGNVLLELTQGVMTYSNNNVLTIADNNNNSWILSGAITGLSAANLSGSSLSISIDPYTGNFVTNADITGTVVITFLYTDTQGNGITYTITVINGSVNSYTAEITDPSPDFDFSTVTNIKVFLNVVDGSTGLPVKQASISLTNAAAEQSWKGYTDDQGVSIFTATVTAASQTTSITVTRAGYVNVQSPIDGIGRLIEIGKKIAMTPEAVVIPPADSDGDGVADTEDDYPADPYGAKMITGSYTFAFEDQYSYNSSVFNTSTTSGNDADFNDLVVRLTIEEKIDSQNKVREIKLTAKPLAALSGNSNSFGIYVNGVRYIMILDSKYDSAVKTQTIPLSGVDRNLIGAMPYDPFMVPNGGNIGTSGPNEVHLASVNTTYTGVRTGNGFIKTGTVREWNGRKWVTTDVYAEINGFVWGLILPSDWMWPNEGTSIGIAYPDFVKWCNSDGKNYINWYSSPASGNVTTRYGL
ncbi:MAG: hypothetical protein CVV49_10380 [Spirochaetae bacterium HGW-Spirochaetae-5]|nr:MAG: hypothetical protein CVV49_10380 [Spirochaetae bacterium HGW-Spirochaetae-5]